MTLAPIKMGLPCLVGLYLQNAYTPFLFLFIFLSVAYYVRASCGRRAWGERLWFVFMLLFPA